MDLDKLETLIKELNMMDNQPTPIRDLRKLLHLGSHQIVNYWLSGFLIVLAVIVLGIMSFLIYRYYKLGRKPQSPNDP